MNNLKTLRTKSKEELLKEISILKGQLLVLRFQLSVGQLQETSQIKFVKKDIARVFTVLKEMEIENEKK